MSVISLTWNGPIATITVNRPKQLNALNQEVLTELEAAIENVSAAKECRCVIVTGEGDRAFVAGADIKAMEQMDPPQAQAFSEYGNSVFLKLQELRVPVIAAVNGFAFGGGCELAMACDIRLVSESAVFGLPEVTLGLFPGFGGTQRLSRLVGYGIAAELTFTGKNVKAPRALDIGLANAVFPADQLMAEAVKMAETISAQGPLAVQGAKRVMQSGLDKTLAQGLAEEAETFGKLFSTSDTKGGLKAFTQKEKYQYEGK